MEAEPGREVAARHGTRGNPKNYVLLLVLRGLDFVAVQQEEYFHQRMACPFISIHERVVLDEREAQSSRFLNTVGYSSSPPNVMRG
jgi:hypothetical protein